MSDIVQFKDIDSAYAALDIKENELKVALERYDTLCGYYDTVVKQGGVDKSTAIALETFSPGILGKNLNVNGYTTTLSRTNYKATLEALTVSMEEGFALIAGIFLIIASIVGFILTLIGMTTGNSGGGASIMRSNDIFIKFETKTDSIFYTGARTAHIDSHFTETQYNAYRQDMMQYLNRHFADNLSQLDAGRKLTSARDRVTFAKALEHFMDCVFEKRVIDNQPELITAALRHSSPSLFVDYFKNIHNTDIRQFIESLCRKLPGIIDQLGRIDGWLTNIAQDANKAVDAVDTKSLAGTTNHSTAHLVSMGLRNTSSAAKSLYDLYINTLALSYHRNLVSSPDNSQMRAYLDYLKIDAAANNRIRYIEKSNPAKPIIIIGNLPDYRDRPVTAIKLEKRESDFNSLKAVFDKKAAESDKVSGPVSSPNADSDAIISNRKMRIALDVQRGYLFFAKAIFNDIALGIRTAIKVDRCYSGFASSLESAFMHDCDAYIHHYKLLTTHAGDDHLRNRYSKLHTDLLLFRRQKTA
jgi:hypothetical protein